MRSLPETSARWPDEKNEDRPSERFSTEARIGTAMGADWQNSPMFPGCGRCSASEALNAGSLAEKNP